LAVDTVNSTSEKYIYNLTVTAVKQATPKSKIYMEKQLFVAEEKTLRWAVESPGWLEWWHSNPISLSEEYRAYIIGLIEEENSG